MEGKTNLLDIYVQPNATQLGKLKDVFNAKLNAATPAQSNYSTWPGIRYDYFIDSSRLVNSGYGEFDMRLASAFIEKTCITIGESVVIDANIFTAYKADLETNRKVEERYYMVIDDDTRDIVGVSRQTFELDPQTDRPIMLAPSKIYNQQFDHVLDNGDSIKHIELFEFYAGLLDLYEVQELIQLIVSACPIS